MPIFQHNGALHAFVHIPKCGGTTVEAMLADRFGPIGLLDERYYGQTEPYRWSKSSPQHLVWDDFVRLIPDAMIDRVFAVTRHPLTRFSSSYNFYARSGAVPAGMGPEEWFAKVAESSDLLPFRADNHLRRQSDFVPDRATIFRLEDGLDVVSNWLDATFGVTGSDAARDGNVAPNPQDDRFHTIALPVALRSRVEEFY
ncbi:MAG: sulfotransferase family protein, partial [Boseongicola sp.]